MGVFDRVIEPLGRRFFWIKSTGNIIAQRVEMSEGIESTKEEDFEVYIELKGINPDAVEMTTFEVGEHAEDFRGSKSWRFNPDTKTIEFLRPDPNAPEPEVPIYQKPLSVEVELLKSADLDNKEAITTLYEMILSGMEM